MSRTRRGFTLAEALVTMAVVALLTAIIVPSLRTTIEGSRSTACQSNLRQMAVAAIGYGTVWNGQFPAAILYHADPEGLRISAWDFEQRPDGTVVPGSLWCFSDTPNEVMQCPSYIGASTFGDDPSSGYNYNTSYVGAEGRFPEMGPAGEWLDGWSVARLGVPPAHHRRPSETALFGDAGWKGGANKFMRAPTGQAEGDLGVAYAGGQAFRHIGCTNVAHLDGSTRSCGQCRAGALATQQLLDDVLGYPHNGFLTDDDSAYDPR